MWLRHRIFQFGLHYSLIEQSYFTRTAFAELESLIWLYVHYLMSDIYKSATQCPTLTLSSTTIARRVCVVCSSCYKGGQVTKPFILVKICYRLLYVIQVV